MPVKKPALGRGLDALFGSASSDRGPAVAETPSPAPISAPGPESARITGVRQVYIEEIQPNPFQPRRNFNPEKLTELADSIRENGILQPIIVRGVPGEYQIVAGERRWRAAQQVGLRTVPALVRDFDDRQMNQAAIIENVQRDDLNPVEEARAYSTLISDFGLTQEAVAQSVGKSRVSVTNSLRLLKLPKEVVQMMMEGLLSAGQARPLLTLGTAREQITLAKQIVERDLSARDAERLARAIASGGEAGGQSKAKRSPKQDVAELEEQFSLHLGMKVKILPRNKKSGRIEVHYASLEDFQKVCEVFGVPTSDV